MLFIPQYNKYIEDLNNTNVLVYNGKGKEKSNKNIINDLRNFNSVNIYNCITKNEIDYLFLSNLTESDLLDIWNNYDIGITFIELLSLLKQTSKDNKVLGIRLNNKTNRFFMY